MSIKYIRNHDIQTVLQDHGESFTVTSGAAAGRNPLGVYAGPNRIADVASGRVLTYDPRLSLAAADAVGIARGNGITRDDDGQTFEVSGPPEKDGGWVHLTLKEV